MGITNCADSVDLDLIDRKATIFDEGGLVVGDISCSITVCVIGHLGICQPAIVCSVELYHTS
jgi:hypothetical protein